MKAFIVGGTGFLGYYTALEFLKEGHQVSTISLPDIKLGDWFPKEINVSFGNVFEMPQTELIDLFKGHDVMIYSVGPDDRFTPDAPAYEFFHERLVEACAKVTAAAREAGVKKTIIFNSYFAYFDRIWPEKNFSQHHPYIRVRNEQAQRTIAEGQDAQGNHKMDVSILELPYIFGTMPERSPIWKDLLIKMLIEQNTIYYPTGGTQMLSVQKVAEAALGAAKNGKHGKRYPIGDVNMKFHDMVRLMLDELGTPDKPVKSVPKFLLVMNGRKIKKEHAKQGKESGLDPVWLFREIMNADLFYDAQQESMQELDYTSGGLEESIRETVRLCQKELTN